MFRDLIPLLANRFHIIAPDLPGFGQSEMPGRNKFAYTFDSLANIIEGFTEVVGFDLFAVYAFDYGAPIGFRLAMRHPAGADNRHHLAERQRLRGGTQLRLEPYPDLLAGLVPGEPRHAARLPHARDDQTAIYSWRERHSGLLPGWPDSRQLLSRASRRRRSPA